MLRRKILTSAMASVMALTSVSVVAFADETENAVKNVKTMADLEAFVKELESFKEKDLDDYGSISGERFLAAYDYAENVVNDSSADVQDTTIAYEILDVYYQAVLKSHYTRSELQDLLDQYKKAYESNNILNDELDDPIYNNGNGEYDAFQEAYDDADTYKDSNDGRIITDCYETLYEAYNALTEAPSVTKSEFRTAVKNYEAMVAKLAKYDTWRRGSFSWVGFKNGGDNWGLTILPASATTFGYLEALVTEGADDIIPSVGVDTRVVENIEDIHAILELYASWDGLNWINGEADWQVTQANLLLNLMTTTKPAEDANAMTFSGPLINGTYYFKSASDLSKLSIEQLGQLKNLGFIGSENLSGLTLEGDYSALAAAVDAGEDVPHISDALDISGSYTGSVADLINDGYERLNDINKLTKSSDEAIIYAYNTAVDAVALFNSWTADNTDRSSKSAAAKIYDNYHDSMVTTYRTTAVDEYWDIVNADKQDGDRTSYTNQGVKKIITIDGESQTIGLKQSYLKYMTLTSADIQNWIDLNPEAATAVDVQLKNALALYEAYKTNPASVAAKVELLDTSNSIAKYETESVAGWSLVGRYLQYALQDKFPASDSTTYKKSDVQALYEKALDIVEKTEASVFTNANKALVEARQDANIWLRAANKLKGYKDGDPVEGLTSTEAYIALEGPYNTLANLLADFEVGFDEIYDLIYDTSSKIDSGELEATDALVAALNDTVYTFFALNEDTGAVVVVDGNEALAFTGAGEFISYNRLHTAANVTGSVTGREAAAKRAYDALVAEVKKQTEPEGILGDVNGDKIVNAFDAAMILKAAADGTVDTLSNADFNADKFVNAFDAAAILKAVADGTV